MHRLPLIGTRSAAISAAIVPVGTATGAAFAFPIAVTTGPIAAVTIPDAAMAIPVAAIHVVIVPLAVVAVAALTPHQPWRCRPPLPTSLPLGPQPCPRQMSAIPAIVLWR